jgi:pimeloyl-ACP methyl ester carboxylesterase
LPGEHRKGTAGVLSRVAGVAILIWLVLAAFLALGQQSMIYHPSKAAEENLDKDCANLGLLPWIDKNGQRIGYVSPTASDDPRPPAAVLICHGNAGYALHRSVWIELLRASAPDNAVSVYILEYPGYGARKGRPSQENNIAAAEEALGNLPPSLPVVGFGESMGTGVVSALASRHPKRVTGLVLVTPFDSLASVAKHHYPLLPVSWLMRDQYPSQKWLRDYGGPVAFVVAGRDTITPPERGRALFAAYHGPKLMLTAPEADHNDVLADLPPHEWQKAVSFALGSR